MELIGFYRAFIPIQDKMSVPLMNRTNKGKSNVIAWGNDQESTFNKLKGGFRSHQFC